MIREAIVSEGLPIGPVATFEPHPEGAYRAARALLTEKDRPTAIYCTTDFAAIAAIRAAHRLRLGIGDHRAKHVCPRARGCVAAEQLPVET